MASGHSPECAEFGILFPSFNHVLALHDDRIKHDIRSNNMIRVSIKQLLKFHLPQWEINNIKVSF